MALMAMPDLDAVDEDDAKAGSYPSPWRANVSLGVLVAAYAYSFLDRHILALMVEPIKASLKISDFQIGLLQGLGFGIFLSVASLPIGWLAGRYNRVRIVAAGIFLWSMMTITCGLAGSFGMLFLARIGLGVGEATQAPAGYSLAELTDVMYDLNIRGLAEDKAAAELVQGVIDVDSTPFEEVHFKTDGAAVTMRRIVKRLADQPA